MFDLDINTVRTDVLHRYTNELVTLINEFLKYKLDGYHCYLDNYNPKERHSTVFLQLINYSNNLFQENWTYRVKFPTDPDRQLEVQGAILALAELFAQTNGTSSEIDFEKTLIDLSITQINKQETQDTIEEKIADPEQEETQNLLHEIYTIATQGKQNLNELIILFNDVNLVQPMSKYTEKLEFVPKLEWKRLEEGHLYLDPEQELKARLIIKGTGTAPDLRKIPPNYPLKVKSSINLLFGQNKTANPIVMKMITNSYWITTSETAEHNWQWQLEQI
jgi:hypothetical protein